MNKLVDDLFAYAAANNITYMDQNESGVIWLGGIADIGPVLDNGVELMVIKTDAGYHAAYMTDETWYFVDLNTAHANRVAALKAAWRMGRAITRDPATQSG